MIRTPLAAAALLALAACGKPKEQPLPVQTAAVERRDIVIDAQATGAVEPINVVEVKSKASGQITKMPVETGFQVKPGDLLVEVETRDVQNSYNQSREELRAAETKLQISTAQRQRSDEMFRQRIITAQEHEAAALDYANSQASVVRARTNLDLALQRLEDATVRAPVAGTVIEKTVSLGQVITSATGAFGGGTTLLKMADLGQVRVRALFNESDIGSVQPGQQATVTVDAYPDRPFVGTVEKIEPQAVVQQSVTMFPVLVNLDNREGLLKPGMNGEASVLIDRRANVIAVPNEAVRNVREAQSAAEMLGLNADSVRLQLEAQRNAMMGGMGGGAPSPDAPATVPVPGGQRQASPGSVDAAALRQQPPAGAGGQDRRGGQGGQGGFQMPDVTDAQCAQVDAAFRRDPSAQQRLATLMEQARASGDFQSVRTQSQQIYQSLGIDGRVAAACRRRGGPNAAPNGAPNGPPNGAAPAAGSRGGTAGGQASSQGRTGGVTAVPTGSPRRTRSRSGLVFVQKGSSYEPRIVRLGASNWDYTEVISGLQEGDRVALLAAASLQAQRNQNNQRMRERMGGGMPGMQQQQGGRGAAGGAGGGGGAPGGGAPGGGGPPRGP